MIKKINETENLFSSIDSIIKEYESTKKTKPYLFEDIDKINNEKADDFGYTLENPIKTTTIGEAYSYLDRLRAKDGFIKMVLYHIKNSVVVWEHIIWWIYMRSL